MNCNILSLISIDIRFYSVYSSIAPINSLEKLKETNCLDTLCSSSPYYFEDGLRKVYPAYFQFSSFCKERWLKKTILDMHYDEYAHYPLEECVNRINKGLIKVNNQTVDVNYVLKEHDFVTSRIHRHELSVLDCPIEILYEDDNLFVINKPPSMPVHPCGLYFNNSLLNIIANEFEIPKLFIIYRLDRLASGVLVFAKSITKSRELHNIIQMHKVRKEYICRVEGNFPDETVFCNKPIKKFRHKIGLSLVHSQGQKAFTEFKKLSYNGKSSIVLCKPLTGRTHQIRVHLQYLGHPILNDPIYNNLVFGATKGKNGVIEKPISQLLEDLISERRSEWGFDKLHQDRKASNNINPPKKYLSYTLFKNYHRERKLSRNNKDCSKVTHDDDCYFCRHSHPEQTSLGMFLHASKYEADDWSFVAPMPFWASENWNIA